MLRNTYTNGWFIGRGEDEESERRSGMKSNFRKFRLLRPLRRTNRNDTKGTKKELENEGTGF